MSPETIRSLCPGKGLSSALFAFLPPDLRIELDGEGVRIFKPETLNWYRLSFRSDVADGPAIAVLMEVLNKIHSILVDCEPGGSTKASLLSIDTEDQPVFESPTMGEALAKLAVYVFSNKIPSRELAEVQA